MRNFLLILNSTIFLVLFCFSAAFSLPLTRTCFTLSEEKIDLAAGQDFIYTDKLSRLDIMMFNMGMPGDSSIGFDFSLIHYNYKDINEGIPGDILFNFWHYISDYFDGSLNTGISAVIRIPSGPDVYKVSEAAGLSYGHSEIRITPVLTADVSEHESISFNLSYTFREGADENMYSSFNINPAKSKTYLSLFGLNPFYNNSFLDSRKLKNDYASVSVSVLTARFYPWIFFTEVYYSSGFTGDETGLDNTGIEGTGADPVLSGTGFKYFITELFYIQFSETVNLAGERGYIKNKMTFSLNIFF